MPLDLGSCLWLLLSPLPLGKGRISSVCAECGSVLPRRAEWGGRGGSLACWVLWDVGLALGGKVFGWMSQSRALWVCCCSSEQHVLRHMLFGFSCSADSSPITLAAGECKDWEHPLNIGAFECFRQYKRVFFKLPLSKNCQKVPVLNLPWFCRFICEVSVPCFSCRQQMRRIFQMLFLVQLLQSFLAHHTGSVCMSCTDWQGFFSREIPFGYPILALL